MKTKIANMIPGRKAKDTVSEKKPQNMPEEIEKAEENPPEAAKPENRRRRTTKNKRPKPGRNLKRKSGGN